MISTLVQHLHREWLSVLHNGTISHVNFFHKGLARKFQVVFESGHIAAAKPIEPDYLFSAATYPSLEYDSYVHPLYLHHAAVRQLQPSHDSSLSLTTAQRLTSREKSSVRRMEWEYQGFSEIAAYHVSHGWQKGRGVAERACATTRRCGGGALEGLCSMAGRSNGGCRWTKCCSLTRSPPSWGA